MLTGGEVYYMAFRQVGSKPQPEKIKPCED
jgi:hypothetical protein